MPEPLTSYITLWRDNVSVISSKCWQLGNALESAATYIDNQNWTYAALFINSAAGFAHAMAHEFKFESAGVWTNMYNAMHYVDENIGGGAEVTMDAILSAMITSSFDDLEKFIGIVDAYRVALWNAPFNADFYAALARGFQKWP